MRARTRRRVRRGGAACRTYPPLPPCACRCITGSLYCRLLVLPAPCIAGSASGRSSAAGSAAARSSAARSSAARSAAARSSAAYFYAPAACLAAHLLVPPSAACAAASCVFAACLAACTLIPPLCTLCVPSDAPSPPLLPGHVAVGCCRPVGCLCMCAGIFLSLTPGNPVNPVSRPSCCSILSSWRVFSAALRSGPTRLTNEADLRSLTKLAWAADLGCWLVLLTWAADLDCWPGLLTHATDPRCWPRCRLPRRLRSGPRLRSLRPSCRASDSATGEQQEGSKRVWSRAAWSQA